MCEYQYYLQSSKRQCDLRKQIAVIQVLIHILPTKKLFGRDKAKQQRGISHRDFDFVIDD